MLFKQATGNNTKQVGIEYNTYHRPTDEQLQKQEEEKKEETKSAFIKKLRDKYSRQTLRGLLKDTTYQPGKKLYYAEFSQRGGSEKEREIKYLSRDLIVSDAELYPTEKTIIQHTDFLKTRKQKENALL